MRSATKMLVCGVKIAWQKWNVPTGGAPRRSAIAKKKKKTDTLSQESERRHAHQVVLDMYPNGALLPRPAGLMSGTACMISTVQ
jgi:hypothetical protein